MYRSPSNSIKEKNLIYFLLVDLQQYMRHEMKLLNTIAISVFVSCLCKYLNYALVDTQVSALKIIYTAILKSRIASTD